MIGEDVSNSNPHGISARGPRAFSIIHHFPSLHEFCLVRALIRSVCTCVTQLCGENKACNSKRSFIRSVYLVEFV